MTVFQQEIQEDLEEEVKKCRGTYDGDKSHVAEEERASKSATPQNFANKQDSSPVVLVRVIQYSLRLEVEHCVVFSVWVGLNNLPLPSRVEHETEIQCQH